MLSRLVLDNPIIETITRRSTEILRYNEAYVLNWGISPIEFDKLKKDLRFSTTFFEVENGVMIYIDYHHLELIFPNLELLQKFRIREEFWGKHNPGGLPNEWREIPVSGFKPEFMVCSGSGPITHETFFGPIHPFRKGNHK